MKWNLFRIFFQVTINGTKILCVEPYVDCTIHVNIYHFTYIAFIAIKQEIMFCFKVMWNQSSFNFFVSMFYVTVILVLFYQSFKYCLVWPTYNFLHIHGMQIHNPDCLSGTIWYFIVVYKVFWHFHIANSQFCLIFCWNN